MRHPKPKSTDIANLCKQFLLFANGVDIFPKLPSLVRPGIKRWEINKSIELLGLQTEEGFNALMAELRTTVSLDDPPQLSCNPTSNQPVHASTVTAVGQAQVHVGPITTVGQMAPVSNVNKNERCRWWPICNSKVSVCGGVRKSKCKYYGLGGEREPPPSEREFDRLFRLNTWEPHALNMNCAYFPFCQRKAWDCGGFRKSGCTDHKPLGPKEPPSDKELRLAKQKSKRESTAARRKRKK